MHLSQEQIQVINHTIRPALVLAGPGSGKTTVITRRLVQLISGYPKARIICLTFSRAAAREMECRFNAILPEPSSAVYFATVHSLAYSILKKDKPADKMPILLGSKDCPHNKYSILQKIYRGINNENLSLSDTEKLIGWISRARNLTSDILNSSSRVQIKNFEEIKKRFEIYKNENNLIDFDDMILYARDILQNDNAQRAYWSSLYNFVQIDEGQDLTPAQFEIIKLIAPHKNIFIVADDDQSIYGFRGAAPENMMNFERASQCTRYVLSNNFRCAPEIVRLSSNIIKNNSVRFCKDYVSQNKIRGKVYLLHTKDTYCQAKFIYDDILKKAQKSFGILYRNNYSSLPLAAILIKNNISFQVSGGTLKAYTEYINLFLVECIKSGGPGCQMSQLYKTVISKGFISLCENRKKLYEQDSETIAITVDCLYTVFKICKTLSEVRNLLVKLTDVYESGRYEGGILPEKEIFLSTIHSAKGLEYDAVYLININKDEFPGKSSVAGKLLEEERRLFYVGITRARQLLYIMFVENYGLRQAEESVFYREAIAARRKEE